MQIFSEDTRTKTNFCKKSYEKTNHLGNVLTVITDRKLAHTTTPTSGIVDYFSPEVVSSNDYYAFGSPMPGRKYQVGNKYRYGFQSQEEDPELWGGAVSFKYRIEDPRLGRFFSVDPLASDYAFNSPYAFAENKIGLGIELEGKELFPFGEFFFFGEVPPVSKPVIEILVENAVKTAEVEWW